MEGYQHNFQRLDSAMPVLQALVGGAAVMMPMGLNAESLVGLLEALMGAAGNESFKLAHTEFRPELKGIRVGVLGVRFVCTLTDKSGDDLVQSMLPAGVGADRVVPICAVENADKDDVEKADGYDGQATFIEACGLRPADFDDAEPMVVVPRVGVWYVDRGVPPPAPKPNRKRARVELPHAVGLVPNLK